MPLASGIALKIFIGILGAFLIVSLLSAENISVNALDFTFKLAVLTPGYSELAIPPLGSVRAKTHSFPLGFSISLKNINLERLRALIGDQEKEILPQIVASFRSQVRVFLLRALLLAFLGGVALGLFTFRQLKFALVTGAIGALAFGVLLGGALLTYDESAFTEPEFSGIVEVAPWLMGVAEEALVAVKELDNTLEIVAANLVLMFDSLGQIAKAQSVETGLTVLHVSDIHNNPLAVTLVNQAAKAFNVDIVIDTGDITDYGTPIEADLAANIADSGLPWFFVPGNHDSPAVIEALAELANVTILQEDVVHLAQFDLCIAGIADPSADDFGMTIPSRQQYRQTAIRLKQLIAASDCQPQIIAAHHPFILDEFANLPIILLHGHSHHSGISATGPAVIIDAGTTGGAGIRGLITTAQVPYTMVLLHLERRDEKWQAVVADLMTINPLNASFTLERKLIGEPADNPAPPDLVPSEEQE